MHKKQLPSSTYAHTSSHMQHSILCSFITKQNQPKLVDRPCRWDIQPDCCRLCLRPSARGPSLQPRRTLSIAPAPTHQLLDFHQLQIMHIGPREMLLLNSLKYKKIFSLYNYTPTLRMKTYGTLVLSVVLLTKTLIKCRLTICFSSIIVSLRWSKKNNY